VRVLAVVNQKGGSGKTTAAVNLAAALAEQERRVLLLDLDPQASATHWYRLEESGRGLLELLTGGDGNFSQLVRPTAVPELSMLPSSSWLMAADRILAGEEEAELHLGRHLEALEPETWDYVMMDCPPNLGALTVNALAAAREVLIPVETHVLPLHGLAQLLETIEVVRERLNPELEVSGILACRVDRRTRLAREIVEDLRERFGDLVYETVIRENVRLAECPSFGKPILQYARRSAGAEDFRALASEVIAEERSH
jgi:chromosome partitioning protein